MSPVTSRSTAARTSAVARSSASRRDRARRRQRAGRPGWSASSNRSRAIRTSTSAPTRSCRSCARPPTTSTSRLRTPSIPRTTSAHRPATLLDTVRYPTTPNWDATFGYGRVNIYEAVKAVRDGRIPPEADIASPRWFDVLPARGKVPVTGRVAAPHASSYDFRLEWATGLQPPLYPKADVWHEAAHRTGLHAPFEGKLGSLDLRSIADALPNDGAGAPVDATGRPSEERFTVRLRVVVTAHGGAGDDLTGEQQKQVFVHDDPAVDARLPAPRPRRVDREPGVRRPRRKEGRRAHRRDRRRVRARVPSRTVRRSPAGRCTPRWRATGPASRARHARSASVRRTRRSARARRSSPTSTATAQLEVVVSDIDGNVWAWEGNGHRRPGFATIDLLGHDASQVHINPFFSADLPTLGKNEFNRLKRGIASEPAAGDLDGDGHLEIVVAALDRHVYAWHDDGTKVAGFPVLVVDPAKVASDRAGHAVRHLQARRGCSRGRRAARDPGARRPHRRRSPRDRRRRARGVRRAGQRRLRAPTCSRCCRRPARSATGACTRSRPTAPTRRTRAPQPVHPERAGLPPGLAGRARNAATRVAADHRRRRVDPSRDRRREPRGRARGRRRVGDRPALRLERARRRASSAR